MPETVVHLRGPVRCARAAPPLGLTLSGVSGTPPERALLAFSGEAPAELPDTLAQALVERLDPGHYRIASGADEWRITASAVHLHLEVAAPFYQAIPPRRVPWLKRLFWKLVLALAASRAGLALLGALRR